MISRQGPPSSEALSPDDATEMLTTRRPSVWAARLDKAIYFFFLLFAILLPHSIKGAQRAWRIAFLFWLARLGLTGERPFRQPLSAPLLAYVTLSGISTTLSPDPYLSWDR